MPRNPEDYTNVRASLAKDGDVLVLTPCDEPAAATLQQVLDAAPDALHWHSRGKRYSEDRNRLDGVRLACGGTYDIEENDYAGALTIYLDLMVATDHEALRILSVYCWATGIAVDPASTLDRIVLYAATNCKVCDRRLPHDTKAMEYQVCNACAIKCDHDYTMGAGVYDGNLAHLRYCRTCGRVDPSWRPSDDPVEDMLNVVAEGDVEMLVVQHGDGSSTTITKK